MGLGSQNTRALKVVTPKGRKKVKKAFPLKAKPGGCGVGGVAEEELKLRGLNFVVKCEVVNEMEGPEVAERREGALLTQ